ncbi:MlaD family protein [Herminiimonas sp. CN]|uniref:MlaD family protein n=1 Tax=Herminiimonas sp. CN TaxID=1349818 RepID=UPI0005590FE0
MPPISHLEFKAALLLILMVLLVSATVIYLMYARGAFESTQKLVLVADDAEGVVLGMDITFAGFAIGRVSRIELNNEGKARMVVEVARKDAHWLRSSSIFTMERGIVGATRLRAFSGMLSDPPLADGAVRSVLSGDAGAEIPRLLAAARELLQNLNSLTATDSALELSLRNVKSVTEKLAGKSGALGVLAGTDENTQKLLATIDRANQLLSTVDGLAVKADSQVFGKDGAMPEARAAVKQLGGLLTDARASLKKVDAVLLEAQAVGANLKDASADLAPLRAEVESNLRKIEQLVNEINRKWPFRREAEVRLP